MLLVHSAPQMHTPFTVNKELDGSCTKDTIIKSHDAHSAYCVVNFYHLTKIPNPLEVKQIISCEFFSGIIVL